MDDGTFALPVVIVIVCLSALNAIWPRTMWGLFKGWQYKNPDTVEPSDLVVAWYRISGVLGIVAGVGLGFASWSEENRRIHCQEVMAELSQTYQDGDIADVQLRARELEVAVERVGGDYAVSDDGERLGRLSGRTGEASTNCL